MYSASRSSGSLSLSESCHSLNPTRKIIFSTLLTFSHTNYQILTGFKIVIHYSIDDEILVLTLQIRLNNIQNMSIYDSNKILIEEYKNRNYFTVYLPNVSLL